MKKFCVLLICLICIVGCSNEEKKTYHSITSDEAYNMITEKEDTIILDVRNDNEYKSGHIEGAINIPVSDIETFKEINEDKNVKIIVYCASGNRSKSASEKLIDMGYTEVYNLGGINNWKYEIVTE